MLNLIGIILPPLIDFINGHIKSSQVRFLVSFALCALIGIGINYLETSFIFPSPSLGAESISKSIMTIFGIAQLVYKGMYEDSQMQKAIRNI